jgi:hypothetical protein
VLIKYNNLKISGYFFIFKMSEETENKQTNEEQEDFEAKQNLLGFFNLLLQIDKRNNPEKYENNEDNRDTNNTN